MQDNQLGPIQEKNNEVNVLTFTNYQNYQVHYIRKQERQKW